MLLIESEPQLQHVRHAFSWPVFTAGVPRMTFADSKNTFDKTANETEFPNRKYHVLAARWAETTRRRL
jgi:hypothetical protein